MRGYVDTTAAEVQPGDTVIDPMSGVLARVESVDPENEQGVVTLHMRGSVSLGYMGIVAKPDRPLRRAPRPGMTTIVNGNEVMGERVRLSADDMRAIGDIPGEHVTNPRSVGSPSCACGMKSRASCASMCLKG